MVVLLGSLVGVFPPCFPLLYYTMNNMRLTHTKTSPVYLSLNDDKLAAILLFLFATGLRTIQGTLPVHFCSFLYISLWLVCYTQ
jgi:hypothetical protein